MIVGLILNFCGGSGCNFILGRGQGASLFKESDRRANSGPLCIKYKFKMLGPRYRNSKDATVHPYKNCTQNFKCKSKTGASYLFEGINKF